MQMLTRAYVRVYACVQKVRQKARRKDREGKGEPAQPRENHACNYPTRAWATPSHLLFLRLFFLLLLLHLLLPRHPRRPRQRPPSSLLSRTIFIYLPPSETRRPSQSRTSRRCVIRIFFAQMTPDPPLGSRRDPTDDDRGANTSPPPSPSPPPPPSSPP